MDNETKSLPVRTGVAEAVTTVAGHRLTLVAAITGCVAWTAAGVALGFPTEWFLVSNIVGTTAALLILLLIQNTKTRQALAVQAKVDQLILSSDAGNHWIGVERHEVEVIQLMRAKHHSGVEEESTRTG